MNVEEYISSGILESYVMDQLSDQARMKVEKAIEESSEIREEVARIEHSFEALAFATAVEPKASLKSSILDQLTEKKEAPVVKMQQKAESPFLKYAVAASIIVALSAAVIAFNYWNKWQDAENKLATIIAQNQDFAANYNSVNQQLDDLKESVAIMNSSQYKRVIMYGTDNAPNALATIYWNESAQKVFLSIQNLMELSQDQQYQLWAIIDGNPVDAGIFDPSIESNLMKMKNIGSGAAAFAITIEPRGGSENPSLETMQVVGNV